MMIALTDLDSRPSLTMMSYLLTLIDSACIFALSVSTCVGVLQMLTMDLRNGLYFLLRCPSSFYSNSMRRLIRRATYVALSILVIKYIEQVRQWRSFLLLVFVFLLLWFVGGCFLLLLLLGLGLWFCWLGYYFFCWLDGLLWCFGGLCWLCWRLLCGCWLCGCWLGCCYGLSCFWLFW